jgi:hypothetical protein
MQAEPNILQKVVNYLIPPEGYLGKKITDKTWIKTFVPFAPYTALVMCGLLILLGLMNKSPKPFLLTLQGFAASLATFWTMIFLILSRVIRKKKRNPALSLLIANFFPIKSFVGLILVASVLSFGQKKFDPARKETSHTVRNKIDSQRSLLKQKTQELEKTVLDHQQKVQNNIDKMKEHQAGALERFIKTGEEFDELFKKSSEEKHKRWLEQKERFDKNNETYSAEQEKKWEQIRREQLKRMGFGSEEIYQKIYGKPNKADSNDQQAAETPENPPATENVVEVNPPFIWDKSKWLKEKSPADKE